MTEENNNTDILREKLLQQLEVEVGLPLIPKSAKELERKFQGSEIVLNNYPIKDIKKIRINGEFLDLDEIVVIENEGTVYLPSEYAGELYIEYIYGIPEFEFSPILDLMVEYESDNDWKKDASSIKEINVSVSYDTSLGRGARIQSMIEDLRNRYNCLVRMI